jgi:hypothetical protein
LNGYGCPEDGYFPGRQYKEEIYFQRFPDTAAKLKKEPSIVEKIFQKISGILKTNCLGRTALVTFLENLKI